MTSRSITSTSTGALLERVLAVVSDEALAEPAAMRVFDALGALAAARGVGRRMSSEGIQPSGTGLVAGLCAVTRSSEVDDIHRESCTTPASVAVPVALAAASEVDADGSLILRGIIAGYEAMVAIGEAIDGPQILYTGIWPSYFAAPIAAAATAATVLELDLDHTLQALAIAATRLAGAVGRPVGEPTSRWLVFGWAAGDGVAAARAAQAGVRGDPELLGQVLQRLGADPVRDGRAAAVTAVDVKPFCTSRQGQATVLAAQSAWADLVGGSTDEISAIEVGVPEAYRAMLDVPLVSDRLRSITSAQFQIAAALLTPERLYDVARSDLDVVPEAARLMAVTTVVSEPSFSDSYPQVWPGQVTIRTRDGRSATRTFPPGGVEDAEQSWSMLVAKHAAIGAIDDLAGLQTACIQLLDDARRPAPRLLSFATDSASQTVTPVRRSR